MARGGRGISGLQYRDPRCFFVAGLCLPPHPKHAPRTRFDLSPRRAGEVKRVNRCATRRDEGKSLRRRRCLDAGSC